MPITYDPDTNTIYVIGGTEATPFSFEDVYQASESNGWGVVEKIKEAQYYVKAHLVLGDYETPTYFAHENFSAQIGTPDEPRDFTVRIANVRFVKGKLVCHNSGVLSWRGNFEFKHMVVIRTTKAYVGSSMDSTFNFTDCYFSGAKLYPAGYSTMNLERCWFNCPFDVGAGSVINWVNSLLDNATMYLAGNQYFYNLEVTNPRPIVFDLAYPNTKLYLRDSWFELSRLKHRYDNDETYVQWSFHIRVTDKEGNPVSGADVYLYNNKDELVFHEVTDINGEIPLKYVTQYKITGQGVGEELNVEDFNPHRLVVEKFGYTKFEAIMTIDKPLKNIPIVLEALYTKDELIEELKFLRKLIGNRWKIKDNKLIIYDDDSETLYKEAGSSSTV